MNRRRPATIRFDLSPDPTGKDVPRHHQLSVSSCMSLVELHLDSQTHVLQHCNYIKNKMYFYTGEHFNNAANHTSNSQVSYVSKSNEMHWIVINKTNSVCMSYC
jgi:hypothetical protein